MRVVPHNLHNIMVIMEGKEPEKKYVKLDNPTTVTATMGKDAPSLPVGSVVASFLSKTAAIFSTNNTNREEENGGGLSLDSHWGSNSTLYRNNRD